MDKFIRDKNNGSQIGITEVNSLVSPRGSLRALGKVLGPRRVSNGADLGGWRVRGASGLSLRIRSSAKRGCIGGEEGGKAEKGQELCMQPRSLRKSF